MQLLRLSSFIVLIQISFVLQANDAGTPEFSLQDSKGYILVQENEKSGLITNLPATSINGLLEEMGETRSTLRTQKAELSRMAEARRFNAKDGLITAIMPGGFLYAAVVQQRHHQTVEKLNHVTARIDELSKEITEFRIATFERNLMAALH